MLRINGRTGYQGRERGNGDGNGDGGGAGTRTSTGMSSRSGMGAKAGAGMLECGSIVRGRKIKMVDSRPFVILTSERHTAKAS